MRKSLFTLFFVLFSFSAVSAANMTLIPGSNPPTLQGTSSDTKSTTGQEGTRAYETNTGNWFVLHGGIWNALTSPAMPSSPLPSGAATAAKQDTGNASLTSIDGKVTACNTGAVTVSSALPAGSNVLGKVGIDQAIPGTTNAVSIPTQQGSGTTATKTVTAAPDQTTGAHLVGRFIIRAVGNNNSTTHTIVLQASADSGVTWPWTVQSWTGDIWTTGISPSTEAGIQYRLQVTNMGTATSIQLGLSQ